MEKKKTPSEVGTKEPAESEKAASASPFNKIMVNVGKRVGVVEWTKIEPRFERNINKLISYHNIIYNIVDGMEAQVQCNPELLQQRKVLSPDGMNPWEMIGGWMHYLSLAHYDGQQSTILQKFSFACGKIAQKDIQMQKRTRTHLIKKMRLYTGDGSSDLNTNVSSLPQLLEAVDRKRHYVKSSQTLNEVKCRGEEYRTTIRTFNERSNELQGWIDEVSTVVTLHQHEFLKFSRELATLHDTTHNILTEMILRLGYKVNNK